jgi:membrane protease YdiL (CAAX protease family)
MNNTLNIRTALLIVILSVISAFFAGTFVLGFSVANPNGPQKIYTFLSFIVGQSFMLIPLFWYLISRKHPLLKTLRIKPVPFSTIYYTVILALGVIVLSDEVDKIIQVFIETPNYVVDLNGSLKPESFWGYFLLFIAVVIIAPIGEELLFRGFFQKILEESWKDVTKAVLVTALIFSFIHMNPFWFAQIYILGILLGFLAWKTNSIIPSLILHSLNNFIALLLSFGVNDETSFYLYKGHVSPWILLVSIIFVYNGFKAINRSSVG